MEDDVLNEEELREFIDKLLKEKDRTVTRESYERSWRELSVRT
jgi:hypothetical protein